MRRTSAKLKGVAWRGGGLGGVARTHLILVHGVEGLFRVVLGPDEVEQLVLAAQTVPPLVAQQYSRRTAPATNAMAMLCDDTATKRLLILLRASTTSRHVDWEIFTAARVLLSCQPNIFRHGSVRSTRRSNATPHTLTTFKKHLVIGIHDNQRLPVGGCAPT
jgi:hypothetical protein